MYRSRKPEGGFPPRGFESPSFRKRQPVRITGCLRLMTREQDIYKTTIIGGIANFILLIFKFVAGFVSGSAAMVADAVHSFSDFITDIIVLVFVRLSHKPADEDHDYGHGKYETLASTLIGLILFFVAVKILYEGAVKVISWLRGADLPQPGMIALWAALASIVVKEAIYRYTVFKGRTLHSPALDANAWHHRSDALSSVGTAAGIGGAIFLGERWAVLDPVASIVVGALIVKVSVRMVKAGIDELLERSLPAEVEKEIMDTIASCPEVTDPHDLRTRRIGDHYAIEIHIMMDGDISLRRSHEIVDVIEERLHAKFGDSTHITIHVEPAESENPKA